MKRTIISRLQSISVFILLITASIGSYSQYELARPINNQLRNMFSQITYPDATVEFLYQRSANMIDSTLFDHTNDDTVYTEQWLQIYQEMYYAAHDTLAQIHLDSIDREITQYAGDTINFGIMHWNHYRLKKASMQSGNYFVFDTVNDILYDHASPISTPYILDSLFMASPLKQEAYFKNVVYRIAPSLIFTDSKTYGELKGEYLLQIDFGDGSGYRTINPAIESLIDIVYPTNGEFVIHTKLTPISGVRSSIAYSSLSRIYIKKNKISVVEDHFITDVPGIKVGVYKACQDGNNNKKIIVLKGFDQYSKVPSEKQTNQEYYDRIEDNHLHNLRNFGYDIYMVDWHDALVDMRFNAYNTLMLIEKLKRQDEENGENQEYVIIGVSMGGIIGKYVVNYMESDHYQNDDYEPFFVEAGDPYNLSYLQNYPNYYLKWQEFIMGDEDTRKIIKHNTRLLTTIDSPHQGANIPLSLQHGLRLTQVSYYANLLLGGSSNIKKRAEVNALDGKATRQLLKYWVSPSSIWNKTSTFLPHVSHLTFFNQIKFDNGGNPRFCKVVALSDGAMEGTPQKNTKTNSHRVPNDFIVDKGHSWGLVVLWLKLNVGFSGTQLRTNPGYTSVPQEVFKLTFGRNVHSLEIKSWGFRQITTVMPIVNFTKKVTYAQPYCVVAGGIRSAAELSVKKVNFYKHWLSFGSYSTRTYNTDGDYFCFVPLESALNYTGSLPYNNDILNAPIATKMNNTPFDVIAGNVYPRSQENYSNYSWLNTEHGTIRNDKDKIFNLSQQPAAGSDPDTDEKFAYFTCADQGNYNPIRTFLSMEIGDEEMYLENFYTNRVTSYRPEYNTKVNVRNPYYTYPNTTPIYPNLKGIFSKEKNYNVVDNGFATYYYDTSSSPVNPSPIAGFEYNTPLNLAQINTADDPFGICCDPTPMGESEGSRVIQKIKVNYTSEMILYPNPTIADGVLTIKAKMEENDSKSNLTIYDISGKVAYQLVITQPKGASKIEKIMSVTDFNLKKGIYLLKLTTKTNSYTKRLVIQ